MKFEWDEDKRYRNLQKHGIDFADAALIFDGDTATIEDDRYDYGEQRFITFGLVRGQVIAVVHTETKTMIRIISARKATRYEQRLYFEQL